MPRRSPGGQSGGRRSFWEFWTTLPGFLTAIAALITAVVSILAFGTGNESTREAWAERANPICRQYFDELLLAGEPLISAVELEDGALAMASLGPFLQDATALVADLDAELRQIPAPEMDRIAIRGMLAALKDMVPLLLRAADRAAAAFADAKAGDRRRGKARADEAALLLARADAKGRRFNAVAEDLGAVRCSEFRLRLPGASALSTVG